MEESIWGSIMMIRKKGMASSFGQMEENTQGIGKMENRMEWAFTLQLKGKQSQAYGKMERELDGFEFPYQARVNSNKHI